MRKQGADSGLMAETAGRLLDRRVLFKAGASLAAMGLIAGRIREPVVAQEAPETLAGEWYARDNTGGFSAASEEGIAFQTDFPFTAFAPHWGSEVGYWPRIEARFSGDGTTWSDPVQMSASDHDAGRPDREGRIFGDLVFPGQNQFVRYRTLDGVGGPADVPDLGFTYIDATPGPTIDDVYAAALAPSVAQPPIISRAAWGANESYRYNERGVLWPAEYEMVRHIIIHHTETPNFQDPLVAIRSVYYYHAVTRGWGDIGYNYLVDFMGNVYEGRAGGENVVGGHAYEYAYGSSGIGTMGRFLDQETTPEMQAGTVWITAWVSRNLNPYGVADFHSTSDLATICGHRDVNDSSCPGDLLYGDLPAIRGYVSAVLFEGQLPGAGGGDFVVGDRVEVIVPDANLRANPGVDASLVTTMALGAALTIQDGPTTTDGYAWYEVSGDPGRGWCASFLLQLTASAPAGGDFAVGDVVFVDTDAVNLRSQPALGSSVVAVLPNGATGLVTGGPTDQDGYLWYRLETDAGNGWAAGEFLGVLVDGPPPMNDDFAVGDTVFVATDALNMRSEPGTGSNVVAVLPTGAELTVTGGTTRANGYAWYGVRSDRYGSGWCAADFLAFSAGGGPGIGDDVRVIDGELNLRASPGTGADVLLVLPDGAALTIAGGPETSGAYIWWEVTSDRYGDGWVAGQFLAPR